jgi:hypothetical protein
VATMAASVIRFAGYGYPYRCRNRDPHIRGNVRRSRATGWTMPPLPNPSADPLLFPRASLHQAQMPRRYAFLPPANLFHRLPAQPVHLMPLRRMVGTPRCLPLVIW